MRAIDIISESYDKPPYVFHGTTKEAWEESQNEHENTSL